MSARANDAPGAAAADFFVLRTPLLALDAVLDLARGLSAAACCAKDDAALELALEADRGLLRERLARIAEDPDVRDGIVLTSPDLADALGRWRAEPAARGSRSAERSLVRYVTRIATRSELFGMAGTYALGEFGDGAALTLAPRTSLRLDVRLDGGLARDVVRRAVDEAIEDPDLEVRSNRAAYRVAGRLRVAARKKGSTAHRLVQVRPTPSIEATLQAAREGVSVASLVAALEAAGTPAEDATALVRRLIASELLVPTAQVTVTGADPVEQALEALATVPQAGRYRQALADAEEALARTPRVDRVTLERIVATFEGVGIEVNRRRVIRLDARRDGPLTLPPAVLAEMRRNIDLLPRIGERSDSGLASFREAFERRFATRRVPLLEAMDPDFGIRIEVGGAGVRPGADGARRRTLLGLLERGRSASGGAVELTDADVDSLSSERPATLPDAFALMTAIAAKDSDCVAAGRFQLIEPMIHGPSGARLFGRLCAGDGELADLVRAHLAREQALAPDSIIAELSVVPETEAGINISYRPLLREWEIEYGGGSGAPEERRIDPSDLTLSIENGDVVLRSTTLDRVVIPRTTTAMNTLWVSLPAARLLLALAHQRTVGSVAWSWGELADAPALPRISRGRTIFALRRWNVTGAEFADVAADAGAAGFRRLQRWRSERGLPRLVSLEHPKSPLLVDFENALSVDSLLAATRGQPILSFAEVAVLDGSPVQGPDGRYAHQLVVPFTAAGERTPARRQSLAKRPVNESRRRFAPGSEWLYANLYGPKMAADRVLVEHVGPIARELAERRIADRWFFVRYADPAPHLRVRFRGRPQELLAQALPALSRSAASAVSDGLLYRISFDTYEREIERYGGLEGVELMERIAENDSNAVIEILARQTNAVDRRHLAVASVAALYADAGFSLEQRHACSVGLRASWAQVNSGSLGALLGPGERAERADVEDAVAALERSDADPRIIALSGRSRRLATAFEQLRALADEGLLEVPLEEYMTSLAHMAVNRMLLRGGNHDEARVHDALARLYESQQARARQTQARAASGRTGKRRADRVEAGR
ncbi:MAG TPA: lantibiotic dehydratase [Solirubrobacteraceae bacterium]|jgi:thiopeptide-type bacteriocin biosynthesis protein|nr:lantibiotic dehydratase [Solirubrobacteraceae bacterium]